MQARCLDSCLEEGQWYLLIGMGEPARVQPNFAHAASKRERQRHPSVAREIGRGAGLRKNRKADTPRRKRQHLTHA